MGPSPIDSHSLPIPAHPALPTEYSFGFAMPAPISAIKAIMKGQRKFSHCKLNDPHSTRRTCKKSARQLRAHRDRISGSYALPFSTISCSTSPPTTHTTSLTEAFFKNWFNLLLQTLQTNPFTSPPSFPLMDYVSIRAQSPAPNKMCVFCIERGAH